MQVPAIQLMPGPQLIPHPPQLFGLLRMSVQPSAHSIALPGQSQIASKQIWSDSQVWPHPPQCAGLMLVLTQEFPQTVKSCGQPHC